MVPIARKFLDLTIAIGIVFNRKTFLLSPPLSLSIYLSIFFLFFSFFLFSLFIFALPLFPLRSIYLSIDRLSKMDFLRIHRLYSLQRGNPSPDKKECPMYNTKVHLLLKVLVLELCEVWNSYSLQLLPVVLWLRVVVPLGVLSMCPVVWEYRIHRNRLCGGVRPSHEYPE